MSIPTVMASMRTFPALCGRSKTIPLSYTIVSRSLDCHRSHRRLAPLTRNTSTCLEPGSPFGTNETRVTARQYMAMAVQLSSDQSAVHRPSGDSDATLTLPSQVNRQFVKTAKKSPAAKVQDPATTRTVARRTGNKPDRRPITIPAQLDASNPAAREP
jgi:hypothetical protein